MKRFIAVIMLSLMIPFGLAGTASAGEVVFRDDFDGTTLDTDTWQAYHSTYGDGNNELACLTPNNLEVSDGSLKITAKKETITCPNGSVREYSSGFIGTREKGNFFPRFGVYEIRAKVPHGKGQWPAFWLRHRDGSHIAEVDVMEYFHAQYPNKAVSTLHLQGQKKTSGYLPNDAPGTTPGWHTYAVIMEQDGNDVLFTFLVDGQPVPLFNQGNATTYRDVNSPLINHHTGEPLFDIAINMAVGGRWTGHPDDVGTRLGYLRGYPGNFWNPNPFTARCAKGGTPPDNCNSSGIQVPQWPATYEIDYVQVSSK